MPLMHKKTPKAFKHNVKVEYEEGKPLKQALAIAYSEKRHAEKMADGGMAYAKGGAVHGRHSMPVGLKGVHEPTTRSPGESYAGYEAREAKEFNRTASREEGIESGGYHEGLAKEKHKKVLGEMKSMPKPNLYAHGGEIEAGSTEEPQMHSDDGMEAELHSAMGEELMGALERKDKKAIMASLEAIVMSCLNKGEM